MQHAGELFREEGDPNADEAVAQGEDFVGEGDRRRGDGVVYPARFADQGMDIIFPGDGGQRVDGGRDGG